MRDFASLSDTKSDPWPRAEPCAGRSTRRARSTAYEAPIAPRHREFASAPSRGRATCRHSTRRAGYPAVIRRAVRLSAEWKLLPCGSYRRCERDDREAASRQDDGWRIETRECRTAATPPRAGAPKRDPGRGRTRARLLRREDSGDGSRVPAAGAGGSDRTARTSPCSRAAWTIGKVWHSETHDLSGSR